MGNNVIKDVPRFMLKPIPYQTFHLKPGEHVDRVPRVSGIFGLGLEAWVRLRVRGQPAQYQFRSSKPNYAAVLDGVNRDGAF